jgi:phosphomannomutase
MSETLARAQQFLAEDIDPETREELTKLLAVVDGGDEKARADLEDRFAGFLSFGTAGLRGRVEAGTARMNRSVVLKATWGLARVLLEDAAQGGVDVKTRGVVVGFDGRTSSRAFAEDVAAVLAGLEIPAHIFFDPVSTPLCAFTVTHLAAASW